MLIYCILYSDTKILEFVVTNDRMNMATSDVSKKMFIKAILLITITLGVI